MHVILGFFLLENPIWKTWDYSSVGFNLHYIFFMESYKSQEKKMPIFSLLFL
jgi:hypothetical protein